ncbi:hypothetical protein [Sorangium sp. So ce1000]|uniref:hypothetical protein n=1 Tax=Sorangium sp. So ce1000 TaxID=3133325 RepID=UPI003F646D3D
MTSRHGAAPRRAAPRPLDAGEHNTLRTAHGPPSREARCAVVERQCRVTQRMREASYFAAAPS